MSKKVYIFLADGFEDIEGLMVVDLMRRAGIYIKTVSIKPEKDIVTSHGIPMRCDILFTDTDFSDADMLVLPGGMPGTKHLRECEALCDLLKLHYQKGTLLAAICAAPSVFSGLGFLKGRAATSYPSVKPQIDAARYLEDRVVIDGTVTTSRGLGTAGEFALALIRQLMGEAVAEDIRRSVVM